MFNSLDSLYYSKVQLEESKLISLFLHKVNIGSSNIAKTNLHMMSGFKTPSKTLLEIAAMIRTPPPSECKRAEAGFITPPKYGPGLIQPAWDGEQVSLTVPRRGGKQKKQRRSKGVNKRRLGGVVRCLDDDFLLIDVQERERRLGYSSTAREVRDETLKTLKDEGKSTKHIFGCSRCRWSIKGCVDSKTNPKAKGCRRAEEGPAGSGARGAAAGQTK